MGDRIRTGRILAVSFLALILIGCCILGICNSEKYKVWQGGLAYINYESNDYMGKYSLDESVYTVEIDLDDLDSNTGKRIYENGDCYIEVGLVHNAHPTNGGYRIIFSSYGVSDFVDGNIVSGVSHRKSQSDLTATMEVVYNGITYATSTCGYGGLQETNTDTFGFYVFPTEVYDNNLIPAEHIGTVTVKLTNLTVNEWRRVRNFE